MMILALIVAGRSDCYSNDDLVECSSSLGIITGILAFWCQRQRGCVDNHDSEDGNSWSTSNPMQSAANVTPMSAVLFRSYSDECKVPEQIEGASFKL